MSREAAQPRVITASTKQSRHRQKREIDYSTVQRYSQKNTAVWQKKYRQKNTYTYGVPESHRGAESAEASVGRLNTRTSSTSLLYAAGNNVCNESLRPALLFSWFTAPPVSTYSTNPLPIASLLPTQRFRTGTGIATDRRTFADVAVMCGPFGKPFLSVPFSRPEVGVKFQVIRSRLCFKVHMLTEGNQSAVCTRYPLEAQWYAEAGIFRSSF